MQLFHKRGGVLSSNIVLVTGGSRSGKSSYGEAIYSSTDDVLYIATAIITDEEMEERVRLHQKSRNQNWETIEQYKDLSEVVKSSPQKNIFLDCVTIMVTNFMFDGHLQVEQMSKEQLGTLEKEVIKQLQLLIEQVRLSDKNIVLITNEVGYGLVPEYKLGRIFRDIAGRVNQKLALWSDEVYLVACGLPVKLK